MAWTNSWLCIYAIAQLGKPYLMSSYGKIQNSSQSSLMQEDYKSSSTWHTNPNYNTPVKHHDCSGLIVGALMCDTVDGNPSGSTPVMHGSNSQYNGNCSRKSTTMSNFPYIPGTLVFHNEDGTKTHVGIYVGTFKDLKGVEHTQAVVEAKGRDYGVVISDLTANKWNSWGQLSVCEIDTTVDTKFDASSNSTTVAMGSVTIETKDMHPFVATIPANQNPTINYDKIKEARISAMMFFGGELYNATHLKTTYINPHLPKLVKDCNDSGLPYALYVNVRSTNEIEADAECRALYYVVSQYPPQLGLWLSLQNNVRQEVADRIVDIYYKYITIWGLKARCGLYLTPTQLSKISWSKFQDKFYLWLIDPMDVTEVDDELLQPDMFEVPD